MSNQIMINGRILPELMVSLIQDGTWNDQWEISVATLQKLVPKSKTVKFPVNLLPIEEMRRESEFNKDFQFWEKDGYDWLENVGQHYAMDSPSRTGHSITDDAVLDIDSSVVIAVDYAENMICLDYRPNSNNPRVIALIETPTEWVVIANNFEEFAENIGLI